MTVEITCQECGEQVPFNVHDKKRSPVDATCDCGQVYRMIIKQVEHALYEPNHE